MEKEFVNYNQALKLKKLGFNEPCFACYDSDLKDEEIMYVFEQENTLTTTNKEFSYPEDGFCTIPIFSQAFRFFRKKYGIHSSPRKYDETKWWVEWGAWTSPVFEAFEEAESAWLDKLIELAEGIES